MTAQPLPVTLMPLSTWARIVGVNPVNFNGGAGGVYYPAGGACTDVWPRFPWQDSHVSRYDLAEVLQGAERDVTNFIGYTPAPRFEVSDTYPYPRFFDNRRPGYSVGYKSLTLRYGKFLRAGRRAVTLIGTATVAGGTLTYLDQDGDGFYETARIVLPTTATDVTAIRVCFAGNSGAAAWTVRPLRSVTIAGGSVTVYLDSWLLFDPVADSAAPTVDGFAPHVGGIAASSVVAVEVYSEGLDQTNAAAEFVFQPNAACGGSLSELTQQGGIVVSDAEAGIVSPLPATYASGAYTASVFAYPYQPHQVRLWYEAGDRAPEFVAGQTLDPMRPEIAQSIAWLALARLPRPPCSCGALSELYNRLSTNVARSDEAGAYNVSEAQIDNPFGTRYGELYAYRRLRALAGARRIYGAAL